MYEDLYKNECNKIEDKKIREVLNNTVKNIPEYFYKVPSSSTGKYHPEDEIGEGGLIRHILKCIIIAKDLVRMYDISDYEKDLCIAALLLHDCCKNGETHDSGHTEFLHPKFAFDLIIKSNPDNEIAKEIAKLVKSHMGRWNVDTHGSNLKLPLPKTKLQKIVALSDYIASRKSINIPIK